METFTQKIRIKPRISTNKFQGRYSEENKKWLECNIGTEIMAYRSCINYYKMQNGFMCHIYEATDISK